MKKSAMIAVAILVVATMGLGAFRLQAQGPEANPVNPFAGKVIEVHYKHSSYSEGLQNVELKTFDGRRFLVGREIQDNYREGLETWFAMDDVALITIHKDVDDLNKRTKQAAKPE